MARNHNATGGDATPSYGAYYDKAGLRPPRATLLQALDAFAAEGVACGHAVDLGCGIGRDTLELLRRRWPATRWSALSGRRRTASRRAARRSGGTSGTWC